MKRGYQLCAILDGKGAAFQTVHDKEDLQFLLKWASRTGEEANLCGIMWIERSDRLATKRNVERIFAHLEKQTV